MTTDWQDLMYRFRWQISFLLVGLILAAGGLYLTLGYSNKPAVEIVGADENNSGFLVVEAAGEVNSPGVYRMPAESRIDDVIVQAGGVTGEADMAWVEKNLNRAAHVTDGQKIYIPPVGDQNVTEVLSQQTQQLVNINEASQSELEELSGIGPVYAQKIIENRPYSSVNDLSVKNIIPEKTYESIKNSLSVF